MTSRKVKIAGALSLAIILSGCGSFDAVEKPKSSKQATRKTVVNLAGSGSSASFVKLFEASFEKKYPNVDLNFLPSSGSGDGIKGVGEGKLDVGLSARAMKSEERQNFPNVAEYAFVRDPMVLVVNGSVGIENLNNKQIIDIFSGKATNWKQLKGPDAKIVLLDREESESSKLLLRDKILGKDLKVTEEAVLINSAQTMDKAVDETKFSLGQTSLGMIRVGGYKNILPLSVNGVPPTIENVKSGTYDLVRDFYVVINRKNDKPEVKELVDFIYSDEARKILSKYETLPLDRP